MGTATPRQPISRWIAAVCCAALAAACGSDGKGVAPTSVPAPSGAPVPSDPSRAIVAIQISGPSLVDSSSTGSYTASATRANGSSDDITASAVWRTSSFNVLFTTNQPGVIRTNIPGEGTISATLDGVSAEFAVLVLPAGTTKLSGRVIAATGEPVPGVIVKPANGQVTPLWAFSDDSGGYRVYGVTPGLELRATRDGFEPAAYRVRPGDETIDVILTPLAEPSNVDGAWTMTLSASPACRDQLPLEARERSFPVQLVQRSAALNVTLTIPSLVDLNPPTVLGPSRFNLSGTVTGRNIAFVIPGDTEYGTWSYPELFDRVNASLWLGTSGIIESSVSAPYLIEGFMRGDVETWPSSTAAGPPTGVCRATDHGISLRRS